MDRNEINKLLAAYAAYCNHFAIRRKPGEKLLTWHSWKRQASVCKNEAILTYWRG